MTMLYISPLFQGTEISCDAIIDCSETDLRGLNNYCQ